ncbi:MAG TPA: exo-alpha-sialidase [Actinomycetota bacterium]
MRRSWRWPTLISLICLTMLFVGVSIASGTPIGGSDHLDVRARHRHGKTLVRPRTQPPAVPSEPESLVNDPTADSTSQDTQSETAIALSGSNVSVVFNDSGSCLPNCFTSGTHFTGYSVSTDSGASFTDQGTLPSSTEGDGGDPALATNETTGTLYLATLDFDLTQIQVFGSTDGGATWSSPADASPGSSSVDKPWIAVDNFPGTGQGTVYVAYANYPAGGGIQIMVTSSPDGITWSSPTAVTTASDDLWHWGSYLVVAPDHSVHVFWLDIPQTGTPLNDSILTAASTNGGVSFGSPTLITTLSTTGFAGDLGLGGFSSMSVGHPAVNPANGDLYVLYNEVGAGSDRADVYLKQSTDGGVSWGSAVRINDDSGTNDQWSPAVAVTPDAGHIFVGFYDRRLDSSNDLIDWFGAIGSISSHTITFARPNFRISSESFPPAFGQDPVVRLNYMGDYDSAAADNTSFYTVWGDNRDGDTFFANQPDVRFAKLPASGVDLSLTKTDAPDPASVGDDVTYSLTVEQVGGPDVPTGVTLTDTLPAGVVFASATPSQGSCSEASGTVTCNLGTLSGMATVEIKVTPTGPGTLTDTATVAADQTDLDASNNTATEQTTVAGPSCTITGTEGDDVIVGTVHDDVICGLGGNDSLSGLDGSDIVLGGSGNDQISGGTGIDQVNGQSGDDVVVGGNAKDLVIGGSGSDTLSGGQGMDFLNAQDGVSGNDSADGGLGVDACQADPGDVVTNCP